MAPVHGNPPPALKAHTATLVRDRIFFIGGSLAPSQGGGCFRGVATFNIREWRMHVLRDAADQALPQTRCVGSRSLGSKAKLRHLYGHTPRWPSENQSISLEAVTGLTTT